METALVRNGVAKTAPTVYPGGVSILICTYNRAPLLQRMLDSIVLQLPVQFPLEVIVVDNNSTDETASLVHEMARRYDEIRYLLEPEQGLSHARNGGAKAARFDFLLYLDDDAVLPDDYLANLGRVLDEHDPDFLGGPVLPLFADPKPVWFPESLEVRRKTKISGFDPNVSLTGANYGVRASVLAQVGGFNPRYGMNGNKVGMLEERLVIEVYRRITPADRQRIYYSLENFVMHHTPKRRLTVRFQLERIFVADYQYVQYCLENGVRSPGLLFNELWRRFYGALVSTLKALPKLWRDRRTEPEAPMLRAVKLTKRLANVLGVVNFQLTDMGRVARRRRSAVPQRPLEILFVQGRMGDAEAAAREAVREAISASHKVTVLALEGETNEQLRELMAAVNFRAADVIFSDSSKVIEALSVHRADWPHLQFILWVREADTLSFLEGPWSNKVLKRLLRERKRFSVADQVISTDPIPRRALARVILPMRNPVLIKAVEPSSNGLTSDWIEAWRQAFEGAVAWAPERRTIA